MRDGQNSGRSMIEMLGVLAIIGILTLASFVGYKKALTKSRVNDTVRATAMVLQNYANLILKNTRGLNINGADAVEKAVSTGLNSECRIVDSDAEEYKVCDVPLGEMYIKLTDVDNEKYNFMLFVTMVDEDAQTCIQFLHQGWNEVVPKEWQPNGMIWLQSDTAEADVYKQDAWGSVKSTDIASACNRVCKKGNEYCAVIFDFGSVY